MFAGDAAAAALSSIWRNFDLPTKVMPADIWGVASMRSLVEAARGVAVYATEKAIAMIYTLEAVGVTVSRAAGAALIGGMVGCAAVGSYT